MTYVSVNVFRQNKTCSLLWLRTFDRWAICTANVQALNRMKVLSLVNFKHGITTKTRPHFSVNIRLRIYSLNSSNWRALQYNFTSKHRSLLTINVRTKDWIGRIITACNFTAENIGPDVAFNPQSRRRHLNKLKKVYEMKRYSTQIWKYKQRLSAE